MFKIRDHATTASVVAFFMHYFASNERGIIMGHGNTAAYSFDGAGTADGEPDGLLGGDHRCALGGAYSYH